MTPLLRAGGAGCLESVTALLEAEADPRATDRAGLSAMDYAEHYNRPDLRAVLVPFHLPGT